MFRSFSRPSSGAQWLQWQSLVLPSYRGDSRAVFPLSHDSCRQPQTYVKLEAAITVFELLMMSGVSLKTCWAIKKHWNNKLYYRSHLVGYFYEMRQLVSAWSVPYISRQRRNLTFNAQKVKDLYLETSSYNHSVTRRKIPKEQGHLLY
jgi:hypothetical protein